MLTVLWSQQVKTDKTIPDNKPDIIIRDIEKWPCRLLINILFSGDRVVMNKEVKIILKYKDLTIEYSLCVM
jgi:hypothetical protein